MTAVVPGAGAAASDEPTAAPGVVPAGAVGALVVAADPVAALVPACGALDVVGLEAGLGGVLTNSAWYAYKTTKDRKIARRTRRSISN